MLGLIGLIWGGLLFFGFGPFTFFFEEADLVSNYFVDWFCIIVLITAQVQTPGHTARNAGVGFLGGFFGGKSNWFN